MGRRRDEQLAPIATAALSVKRTQIGAQAGGVDIR
jgi:hypothetical protein